jgi:hypothetical protein
MTKTNYCRAGVSILIVYLFSMIGDPVIATGHPGTESLQENCFPDFQPDKSDSFQAGRWEPERPEPAQSWTLLRERSYSTWSQPSEYAPVIMMAGYMDSDVSWTTGGRFRMLAWVWDPDNDIDTVEIYYEGQPTGVFLQDDGLNGDFEKDDGLFGILLDIPSEKVTPGHYVLELKAQDRMGNMSGLWPYLEVVD